MHLALLLILLAATTPALAEGFLCAGQLDPEARERASAAKPTARNPTGTRSAVVLFAQFADDRSGWGEVPAWGKDLLNPELPGSIAHFYATMSFGALRLTGEVAPRVYIASQPAAAYLPATPNGPAGYSSFCEEIIQQADLDVDFTQFDNDGPDGVPASGDDDGVVDAVFIVLASVPTDFIRGNATGIAGLGDWRASRLTNDRSPHGYGARVDPFNGTLQLGRSFSEASGAICHEYGHLLGLGDLYNTGFLSQTNTPPAEDSAGPGNWDLMGWGATGWQGDDGPTSLGAYSRWRLGWCHLQQTDRASQVVTLPQVGRQGDLELLPLLNGEAFLLEYRTRASSYYDRHLPGEGVLIWHLGTSFEVDLECADGRWQDAGYPAGRIPASRTGEDNLDFWAHDTAYAAAHQGNLGDATDPFDGGGRDSFTPEGNPSSFSDNGNFWAKVEQIRLTPEAATCTISAPPLFEIHDVRLTDADNDGILLAGEPANLQIGLTYYGYQPPSFVCLHTISGDPRLSVVQDFPESIIPLFQSLPKVSLRLIGEFAGILQVPLQVAVEIGSSGETAWIGDLPPVVVVSPWQPVAALTIIDSLGNQDGAIQAGEFIRPQLTLAMDRPDLLQPLSFCLWSLDPRLRLIGAPEAYFPADSGAAAVSAHAPEFLVAGDAAAGDSLRLRLRVFSQYSSWSDTLALVVAPGSDQTPPRVGHASCWQVGDLVHFSLPASLVIDGSPIGSAAAIITDAAVPARAVTVPLSLVDGVYQGTWQMDRVGKYEVTTVAEDAAGNVGRSAPRALTGRDPQTTGPAAGGAASTWEAGQALTTMAWSPDGRWLAVAGEQEVQVLAAADLTPVASLEHAESVTALAFSPDSQRLASGCSDGSISVWEMETWLRVPGPEGNQGSIEDLAYSSDGEVLASAGLVRGSGSVRLWKTSGYTLDHDLLNWPGTRVMAIAFCPRGDLLATSGSGSNPSVWLSVWRIRPTSLLCTLTGVRDWLGSVAFSPDGGLLAGGGREGRVYVWNTDSLAANPRMIAAHTGWVTDVAFSPWGDLLASAGEDHAVILWGADQLGLVASLQGHTGPVNALAFSPDGRRLASAGMDRTVRCWTVPEVTPSETSPLPAETLALDPPFPNPANQGVWIPYRVGETMDVTLRIHDLLGQVVRALPLGRRLPGLYLASRAAFWDGCNDQGQPVASGVYLCTAVSGTRASAPVPKKILLLK